MTSQLERVLSPNLSGIPTSYLPVTPSDTDDNCGNDCIGFYAEAAGTIRVINRGGETQDLPIPAQTPIPWFLPSRVMATGTTATGIRAMQG